MTQSVTNFPGNQSNVWSLSRTAIPLTDWLAITQTSSSPESIAASLNEAEASYFRRLKKPHGNAKRVYPYWKMCGVCSAPYPCHTKEQATRNLTCSKTCANRCVSAANKGRLGPRASAPLTCPVCDKTFRRSPTKRRGDRDPACSRQCRGKRDADLLRVDGYWSAHNYVAASDLIETIYSSESEPLTQQARMHVIKAAVGLVLANDTLGLSRYFRLVIGGDTPHGRKPNPEGLLRICADLDVPSTHTVLVGDSPIDLQTAHNAGTQVLLVSFGFGFRFAADELTAVPVVATPTGIAQYVFQI